MGTLRVGIVGMGIGRPNGRAFARGARSAVTALCDLDPARMDDFAKELPATVTQFTDFKALCRCDLVDAIFIGTPNQLHVPMALEAVKCGKHVMVTKPLADSGTAARKLVEAQEAAGVVGMMSLSTRFGAECQYLAGQARAGLFGELYYGRARSIRRSGIPDWNTGFIARGGGAFRDMGVHVLDAAWYLLGQPRPATVSGAAGARFGPRGEGYWDFRRVPESFSAQYDSDDYAGGLIRFENGTGLQVESFWACHQPGELQIELFGTAAGATLHPLRTFTTIAGAPHDTTVNLPKGPEPWDRIAEHFTACVLDGVPCDAPLRHGWIVQEMLEALLKSAEQGKEVRLRGLD
ncbi:MAG: Gfo/Idh/MocA family oxidoreductase [Fimbriimonadaceae bacterium]|nr:Gfo/Idh/MocA family oxidoreductase [Fimbriimonadaceae bacterium]